MVRKTKKSKKKFFLWYILPVICICLLSYYFFNQAVNDPTLRGLPDVACIDPQKPILKQYDVKLIIESGNSLIPLDRTIGHDYGNCLREIYSSDESGTIHILQNDTNQFKLSQLFEVWRKPFTPGHVLNFYEDTSHTIGIYVNDIEQKDLSEIKLLPNEIIRIVYR